MLETLLTTQAAEIAAAGHAGWGNTMLDAAAELAALRKDAERYRWFRGLLWNQELSSFSKERLWLWSTRFAALTADPSGDFDEVTQRMELDAAVDVAMAR
jgi:hypothetical protein